jgi:thiamine biosynthesis lipoprotein
MRVPEIPSLALRLGAALLCAGLISGCMFPSSRGDGAGRIALVPVSDGWIAMGTLFDADLRVRPGDVDRARGWLAWAREEIARLEHIYSRHQEDSAVSNLNRALNAEHILRDGVVLESELEGILFSAIEVWEESGGAFDPTIGPLIDVWRRAAVSGEWPSLAALRTAKRRVGSGGLLLLGGGELGVTARGMQFDLDGLSKGVVLDRLSERFRVRFPDAAALLSFGQSSIQAIGDPDGAREGGGFRLEIRSRDENESRLATVRLRDQALSVSSSVGSIREIAGQSVSHVVDPRTGTAVEGTVEAVVVSDRAGYADAWSTALLVLGAQRESMRLVERAGIEAYVFESAGRIAATEGWERLEVRARVK